MMVLTENFKYTYIECHYLICLKCVIIVSADITSSRKLADSEEAEAVITEVSSPLQVEHGRLHHGTVPEVLGI